MEETYMSIDRGIDKEDVLYVYKGILLSHKMNEIMSYAATSILILSEVRQRQIPPNINYMWNLKDDTHELMYKTETDSQTYKVNL